MRGRFRLNLSTAIVLMLIAGAFVGANVVPYESSGHFPNHELVGD